MDLTISSESSGELAESPVKMTPVPAAIVPLKGNPAKMASISASSKTTQAEEPRVPDQPDISPPKESQSKRKETVTEPTILPQKTEEIKLNI